MDEFKIANFLAAQPGMMFPEYAAASRPEASELRMKLCRKLGLADDADGLQMVARIDETGTVIRGSASAAGFDLVASLNEAAVVSKGDVYINWHRFEALDRIALCDLSRFFGDIWYPFSDDIDILDADLRWVLSVSHDGELRLLRLPEGS